MTDIEMAVLANELMKRSDAFRRIVINHTLIDVAKDSEKNKTLDELFHENMIAVAIWAYTETLKEP